MKYLLKKILPQSVISKYKFHQIDAFIISYPKCGRSWLRLMLGYYINRHFQLDFPLNELTEVYKITRSESRLPTIRFTHDDDPHRKPVYLLENRKNKYKRKKIVFLIRDPRDVIVSYFFHLKERENLERMEMTLGEFTFQENAGLQSIIQFYNIWAENFKITENLMVLQYEELLVNPYQQLKTLLEFIGIKHLDSNLIAETVEFSRFENVREMEQSGELVNERFGGWNKATKARRGIVGGYKEYFPKIEIQSMNHIINSTLDEYYHYYRNFKRDE